MQLATDGSRDPPLQCRAEAAALGCLNNRRLAYKFGPLPNRTANNKTITHFLNDGSRKFYD